MSKSSAQTCLAQPRYPKTMSICGHFPPKASVPSVPSGARSLGVFREAEHLCLSPRVGIRTHPTNPQLDPGPIGLTNGLPWTTR